jgi:hypothetical protein
VPWASSSSTPVGLRPATSGVIDVPFECPDQASFERAILANGGATLAIEHAGEQPVLAAWRAAATPFRPGNGSYRLANRFRYVIATR